MSALISKPGITAANMGLAIPATWDPVWFKTVIANYLKGADVRNAIAGPGITITGNISTPYATISATGGGGGVSSVTGSGPGILVTPTTGAVVVSNTGVTSIVAGSGISISGGTGAVTISVVPGGGSTGVPTTFTGLLYWFKADSLNCANGQAVLCMPNSTPYLSVLSALWEGSAGTMATDAVTFTTGALNGLPALTFPATEYGSFSFPANFGAVTGGTPQAGLNLPNATIFAVFETPAASAYGPFICGGTNSLLWRQNTAGGFDLVQANTALIGSSTPAILVASTWYQANVVYNSTTGVWSMRCAEATAGNGTDAVTIAALSYCIGDGGGGTYLGGKLAELIIYNTALTLTQIEAVEAYLNTKWGV
jgi:hypothetical protein